MAIAFKDAYDRAKMPFVLRRLYDVAREKFSTAVALEKAAGLSSGTASRLFGMERKSVQWDDLDAICVACHTTQEELLSAKTSEATAQVAATVSTLEGEDLQLIQLMLKKLGHKTEVVTPRPALELNAAQSRAFKSLAAPILEGGGVESPLGQALIRILDLIEKSAR